MLAAYQGRCSSSAPMQQASSPGARPRFRSCTLACSKCLILSPEPPEHPQSQARITPVHDALCMTHCAHIQGSCRRWETRYFQLHGSTLQYFRSKKEAKGHPRGHVDLRVSRPPDGSLCL